MNLSDVKKVKVFRKRRKRVGRGEGSGTGKTSGRGQKGQQARSGYSRRLGHEGGQMPLFRRLPKRGFTNARFKTDYAVLNIGALKVYEAGEEVTLESAKAKGLLPKTAERLKILAKGEVDRPLVVKANRFSEKAAEAIRNAGGTAEEIA
jgi:large subunit ribosomal protein L15